MKTLILTLSIVLLSFPINAQDLVAYNDGNQSSHQMKSPIVSDENSEPTDTKRVVPTTSKIEAMRSKVAEYDLKNEKIYSRHASTDYKVVFTDGTNSIEATYDSRGAISSAIETYENIRLPDEIIKQVMTENQGWAIDKAWYLVSFESNRQSEAQYKIEMTKDSKKRTVWVSE